MAVLVAAALVLFVVVDDRFCGVVVIVGGRCLHGVFRSLQCGRRRRLTERSCLLSGLCFLPSCVGSVLSEVDLDYLPLRDEEFVILRRSLEYKKTLLKMMVVQVLRKNVERNSI